MLSTTKDRGGATTWVSNRPNPSTGGPRTAAALPAAEHGDEAAGMDQQLTPSSPDRHHLARTPAAEPAFRVGEAERNVACDALAEHYAAGRLDPAELDDRLARAMAARSQADLRVLFLDLAPRRTVPSVATPEPPAEPARERHPSGALLPVLASLLVVSLLLAGGMLLALGAYDVALFAAALVGGTATAVAGACTVVLGQAALRRR